MVARREARNQREGWQKEMRERKITRKDEWTGKLGGFDEAEGLLVSFSLSILEADSRVVSQRLPDLTSCSSFLCTKDGTKIHRHRSANCPQGGVDPSTWVALACPGLIRF